MSLATLGIDAYQLTTLVAHADADRLAQRVAMAFFFRKMPKNRRYVVFCGLRQVLEHAAQIAFDERDVATLLAHPLLGPALTARPRVVLALREMHGFEGDIDAVPEGTLAFAGPALRTDGSPVRIAGAPLGIYTPLLQVKTDLPRAKIIETPWLGFINHLSMVASKAARVVDSAAGKTVLEFGARRTHPAAAVDASYAAHVAGCTATSNLAALERYGIPAQGTMDHFAVQASERDGEPVDQTEAGFFSTFERAFPTAGVLLVDTYDTPRGIRQAVLATKGRLTGIRLDSNVNPESVAAARRLLAELGASHVKIFVSDGLDEHRVKELASIVDGFGIGENITCSPDAATGIGAVAKLVVNGYGKVTMKLAKGSGKATLPGELQTYRFGDHDLVALASEPPPAGGRALLEPVWRGGMPVKELPRVEEARAYVRAQIEALPARLRAIEPSGDTRDAPSGTADANANAWKLVASDALVREVERLAKEARV